MGLTPTDNVPWWQEEVEGSERDSLAEKALAYALSGLIFVLSQWRWWGLVIAAPGILIAVILQLHRRRPPITILGNESEDSVDSVRQN